MNQKYRPIHSRRYDDLSEHIQYAYWPEKGGNPDELDESDIERFGDPYGLFDGDELTCFLHRNRVRSRVRGDLHDLAALSTLVSIPEHRGRGFVEEIVREEFAQCREEGTAFAAQWPFKHDFYHRYGFATANKYVRWECSPETFQSVAAEGSGTFRRLTADDWRDIDDAHRVHSEGLALSLDRDEAWWRGRIFNVGGQTPHAFGWERDDEVRGYLIYTMSRTGGRELRVVDVAYASDEAYRNLLGFLASHFSKVNTVRMTTPVETTLMDVVDEPNALDATIHPGPMIRLADVRTALDSIAYPAGVAGSITLRVEDTLCEWNDDLFRLSIEDEAATCERTGADPDVTTDVSTLAQLVVGCRSFHELDGANELTVHEDAARRLLSEAFPRQTVFLRDRF